MKIAICISGQPRFANFGSYHQKKFADALPWDVDFYVQTWSEEGVEERTEELFGYCNPKAVRVDNGYVALEYPGHFHKNRGMSQHYAHYLCMQQIQDWDQYDVIIRTRHDIMFNTDVMDEWIELIKSINDNKGISGAGYYPDYPDHADLSTFTDAPSHRGYSKYPSFDDWTIVAHRDHWSKFKVDELRFLEILDEMFHNERNFHSTATYDVEGKNHPVVIPELVWYNLSNLQLGDPFTVGKGYVYAARPSLKSVVDKHYTKYTPSDVRTALKRAWQNGGDVLRYSIML